MLAICRNGPRRIAAGADFWNAPAEMILTEFTIGFAVPDLAQAGVAANRPKLVHIRIRDHAAGHDAQVRRYEAALERPMTDGIRRVRRKPIEGLPEAGRHAELF